MKELKEFLTESLLNEAKYNFYVPLDEIVNDEGNIVVKQSNNHLNDFYKKPSFEFVFKSTKDLEKFINTNSNRDFWLCIYDYDCLSSIEDSKYNNINKVTELMNSWGNIIINNKLYIFCNDLTKLDEFTKRCQNAENTLDFKKVTYYEK